MSEWKSYGVGLNNVGSYQVSGVPFITGSAALGAGQEYRYGFPFVARSVTVINHSANDIRVHFNSTSSGHVVNGLHYVELDSDEDSFTFNVKCSEIYISAPAANAGNASYRIAAELTRIHTGSMFGLTGSGLTSAGPLQDGALTVPEI